MSYDEMPDPVPLSEALEGALANVTPTPPPLAVILQNIPYGLREDPRLRPMPPFEGSVLVGEFNSYEEAIAALNPEAVPMCVFVTQVADDSFGIARELGWFVFRMLANVPAPL